MAAATIAAYSRTFHVPFLLDDACAISSNPSIVRLADWRAVLDAPQAATTAGRPLLNLSFALNYAVGGLTVESYHLANLGIHVLAGLLLFGLFRRAATRAGSALGDTNAAGWLALGVAAVWMLQPVQTEAVTYISERAESLMGLFALLTLYAFMRGVGRPGEAPRRRWYVISVASCLGGMATKEIMAPVPVVVLLFDRAFVAASFREALAVRRWYYAGLAASWVLLAGLMTSASVLGHPSVGFHTPVPIGRYLLTEAGVLVHYAGLVCWPHPLVFDYGVEVLVRNWQAALPSVVVVIAGAGVAVLLWRRSKPAGFLLGSCFLLLAPTTLVPVAFDPMAESRLYLPSAAFGSLLAVAAYTLVGRRVLPVLLAVAVAFGLLTWRRNDDYASAVGLWRDTVAKAPGSSRAHYSLGCELAGGRGQTPAARRELRRALRIRPVYPEARSRYADLLVRIPGRLGDAIAEYRRVLRRQPDYVVARNNLGIALQTAGRTDAARREFERAIGTDPRYSPAQYNLANLLARTPADWPAAIVHYRAALQVNPGYTLARNNLALIYAALGRRIDAIRQLRAAMAADPACPLPRENLARLMPPGRPEAAAAAPR